MTVVIMHTDTPMTIGRDGFGDVYFNGEYIKVAMRVLRQATKKEYIEFAKPHGYTPDRSLGLYFYEVLIRD